MISLFNGRASMNVERIQEGAKWTKRDAASLALALLGLFGLVACLGFLAIPFYWFAGAFRDLEREAAAERSSELWNLCCVFGVMASYVTCSIVLCRYHSGIAARLFPRGAAGCVPAEAYRRAAVFWHKVVCIWLIVIALSQIAWGFEGTHYLPSEGGRLLAFAGIAFPALGMMFVSVIFLRKPMLFLKISRIEEEFPK